MCDKHSFRQPVQPIKQAGNLYLEYLERKQKEKEHQEPGTYSALMEDYFR